MVVRSTDQIGTVPKMMETNWVRSVRVLRCVAVTWVRARRDHEVQGS
jgi:hypothetical protein